MTKSFPVGGKTGYFGKAGAAAGALIRSKGDSKDIARGALAGAAIGGAGGYIYDRTN